MKREQLVRITYSVAPDPTSTNNTAEVKHNILIIISTDRLFMPLWIRYSRKRSSRVWNAV